MGPKQINSSEKLSRIQDKLVKREMQLHLIHATLNDTALLKSKILPSVIPSIGRVFKYRDLELISKKILGEARERILKECSVVEAEREVAELCHQTSNILTRSSTREELEKGIQHNNGILRKKIRAAHEKKINFHMKLTAQPKVQSAGESNMGRRTWRNRKKDYKKRHKKAYLSRKQKKRNDRITTKVARISQTTVRNFSSLEIPEDAFLYLDKGLNFVESKTANKEDIVYDTKEFLRKLEWKAFFAANPKDDSFSDDIHADLRIRSRKHPENFSHPLFDDIKTRLLGFARNFVPEEPESNLTGRERRGKAWLLKMTKAESLFVTKADKGGATLIMDYQTVVECIERDLQNETNFTKSELSVDEMMTEVRGKVVEKTLDLLERNNISEKDKKLITGLNENNNLVQSPEFRPTIPYTYPLFKVHKLNEDQLHEKKIPPTRLVHATREGPLYRLEKWTKPYLTDVSRRFCGDEFLLDTPDLLEKIKELNQVEDFEKYGDKLQLFTLDVIALYPSIKIEFALESLKEALRKGELDPKLNTALYEFTELILNNAFIGFKGSAYSGKIGIPTGNCISRQVADNTLHHLMFDKIKPNIENLWDLILFWKRFIDDVFGVWRGTLRQFNLFVQKLNMLAKPFGIQFGDQQVDRSVNYLDVTLYLDDQNQIQYKLFTKETDARLYLQTNSFHPPHVFKSVVYSQMIRVIRRNSKDATCVQDLEKLKSDLARSGHSMGMMEELEPKATLRAIEMDMFGGQEKDGKSETSNKLIFSVKYFKELEELRKFVSSVEPDIKQLCGTDLQVTFAIRKQQSIGNVIVRNRTLSETKPEVTTDIGSRSQKCGKARCKTCPFLFEPSENITVNGEPLLLDFSLNCSDKNIIYIAQCTICSSLGQKLKDDTYFGQTMTPMHIRMNGHRSKFVIDERLLFEKSALSMHCFLAHKSQFSMEFFKLGIVKRVRPVDLDREEEKLIQKFRTNICGLNRIVVVR